jgi:hypothetical protein
MNQWSHQNFEQIEDRRFTKDIYIYIFLKVKNKDPHEFLQRWVHAIEASELLQIELDTCHETQGNVFLLVVESFDKINSTRKNQVQCVESLQA